MQPTRPAPDHVFRLLPRVVFILLCGMCCDLLYIQLRSRVRHQTLFDSKLEDLLDQGMAEHELGEEAAENPKAT